MLYKDDWDQAKQRLEALWSNEVVDRCCVAVTAVKDGMEYIKTRVPDNEEDLVKFYTDAEWILERSVRRFESFYFGGEAFPCIWPNFGTAGHAKYFSGSKYKFTENTVWYEPSILDWETDRLEFELNNSAFNREKEILQYLANEGKDKFFVSMPDNCGNLDALAHLRGSSELLLDMLEDPDVVKASRDKIIDVLKNTGNELFDAIYENNENGSTHGWMLTWSKGKHLQLQCDLSVMISPKMYEEFVLPELEEVAGWLDYAVYHFDGKEQINHLDMILSVKNIRMIQWTPVAGQPFTSDFIPVLKKIQKAGKGLVLFPQVWEVEKLLTELSSRGLYLILNNVGFESEARELVKKVESLTKI